MTKIHLYIFSVDIMGKKLDPENLGIILLNAFIDEFFPEEKRSVPDTFDVLHYNGIPGSNSDNRVNFVANLSENPIYRKSVSMFAGKIS